MIQDSKFERIMAFLVSALKGVPDVQFTVLERAPREGELNGSLPFKREALPTIFLWEGEETVDATQFTNRLVCSVPISTLCVFACDDEQPGYGMRTVGRRMKALIQAALSRDPGLGTQENTAPLAYDTLEITNFIGPLPGDNNIGGVGLDHVITYHRGFDNPYGDQPLVAEAA